MGTAVKGLDKALASMDLEKVITNPFLVTLNKRNDIQNIIF